jgi:hypothetical protein
MSAMSNPRRDADARLSTIRALLAKAEATPFAAEADAFTAKASELMARHAIDEALVWAHDSGSERATPIETRIVIHRPFLNQKATLVHRVADALGCRTVRFVGHRGAATETMSIVGFAADLELVDTLVTSLLLQLTTAMMATTPSGLGASQVAAWRRSFIAGFSTSVAQRLAADRAAAATDRRGSGDPTPRRGASTALVLADRAHAVDDEFRRLHPHLRQMRIGNGSSRAGHQAGSSAGRRADLGARRLHGQRALPA